MHPAPAALALVLAVPLLGAAASADHEGLPVTPFAAAGPALVDVARRFGPETRVLRVSIHPEETAVAVQDPAAPEHVDEHRYGPDGPPSREPMAVGRSLRKLRARLFRLSDIDVALLPRLLAEAPVIVDTEAGAVSHVLLERPSGSGDFETWGAPRWRVYVDGPRGGGYVEYGLDGDRKDVQRW